MRKEWQSRKRGIGRMLSPLLVFWLAAAFIIGTPPLNGTAWAVELDRECSLQVKPVAEGGSVTEGQPGEKVDVAVDLYLVAEAREVSGYDTYDYRIGKDSPYYSAITSFVRTQGEGWEYEEDSEGVTFRYLAGDTEGLAWDRFSQEAAAAVLAEGAEWAPAATGETGTSLENLEAGLYLVVARSSGLESREDYVTVVETEEGGKDIATLAYTEGFLYRFRPQLVSLPTKEPEAGNISTANGSEWLYALDGIELKFELEPRYASLEIEKGLSRYAGPATFVFEVEASLDGSTVYSDVVTLSFDENSRENKVALVEGRIPAGADVTVTEVYSGAVYSLAALTASAEGEAPAGTAYTTDLASGRVVIASIGAGNIRPEKADGTEGEIGAGVTTRVTFINDYNGSGNGGGAVTNHFERSGEGAEWNWNQYQYDAASGRWEWNASLPAVTDTTVR